jgi:hypothetical protein
MGSARNVEIVIAQPKGKPALRARYLETTPELRRTSGA